MLTDKAISLCVLEILRAYTDALHPMPALEISRLLDTLYGFQKVDRRTVYSAIDTIASVGYAVSRPADNKRGYYLITRPFSSLESRLLTDAVRAFPLIPEEQALLLSDKITAQLSRNERGSAHHLHLLPQAETEERRAVFSNMELLDEAIHRRVKVRFEYLEYGVDLLLHPRRTKRYTESPCGMVLREGHYSLVCVHALYDSAVLYRLDRMRSVELTELPSDSTEPFPEAVEAALRICDGEPEEIVLLCPKTLLNSAVECFGRAMEVTATEDGRLRLTAHAPRALARRWALLHLAQTELLAPRSLREEILHLLRVNAYTK